MFVFVLGVLAVSDFGLLGVLGGGVSMTRLIVGPRFDQYLFRGLCFYAGSMLG